MIVAAGATQSYFGNDQFAEYAPGMKSIDDAMKLRSRIFGAFELAELEPDLDDRARTAQLRRNWRWTHRRRDGRAAR